MRRRLAPGEVAFLLLTVACVIASFCLALLPDRLADGPSMSVVYDLAPRSAWAVVWALMAMVPALALARPSPTLRAVVYAVMLPASVCWTAGLAWPLTTGIGNFWLPLPWALLTALGMVAFLSIPLDSAWYGGRASTAKG